MSVYRDGTEMDTVREYSPEKAMATGIKEIWQQRLLMDYVIKVEKQEFNTHKLALAAMSDYFRVMLTGNMKESQHSYVELKGVSAVAVKALLEFIYCGILQLNEENCTEVLAGAVHLQIHSAIVVCAQFLVDNLSVENCFDVLEITRMYTLSDTEHQVTEFIKKHAQAIIRMGLLDCLHFQDLDLVLDNWHGSEWDLFLCIKQWISSDPASRGKHTDPLMQRIRFSLMTEGDLQYVVQMSIYAESDGSRWRVLVEQAMQYHQAPVWVKVTENSEQTQMRSKAILVAFSCDKEIDEDMSPCGNEFYGLHDDWCWRKLPNMSHTFPQASVIVVNNFLLVVGGCHPNKPIDTSPGCHIFDPMAMKWYPAANMRTPRIHFPLVESEFKVYALGGCYGYGRSHEPLITSQNEVLDLKTNTWSSFPSLPRVLRKHCACIHNGSLYVSGGISDGNDEHDPYGMSRNLDCFDISKGKWVAKARMSQPRFGHSMFTMKLDGDDALFVMGLNLDIEYYIPSENQWTKYILPYSASLPSYGTLISGGDSSVYVIAGRAMIEPAHMEWSDDEQGSDSDGLCENICVRLNFALGDDQGPVDKLPDFPEKCSIPLCAVLHISSDVIDSSVIIPPVTSQIA